MSRGGKNALVDRGRTLESVESGRRPPPRPGRFGRRFLDSHVRSANGRRRKGDRPQRLPMTALTSGTRLGLYEILSPLGATGLGPGLYDVLQYTNGGAEAACNCQKVYSTDLAPKRFEVGRGRVSGGDGGGGLAPGVLGRDVVVHEGAKGYGELFVRAFQRREVLAVDVDGTVRLFAGAGKADADRRSL
jgi:hypothetical protein